MKIGTNHIGNLARPILVCTLAINDDPDEMLQNTTFHKVLQCLLRQKQSSVKEILYSLEILTYDSLYMSRAMR